MSATKRLLDEHNESNPDCQWCESRIAPGTAVNTAIGHFCCEDCAEAAREQYSEDLYREELKNPRFLYD